MTAPSEDLINRLGKASLEAKELLREVHQAQKDLRNIARNELPGLVEEWNRWIAGEVEGMEASVLLSKIRDLYDEWLERGKQADKIMTDMIKLSRRMQRRALELGVSLIGLENEPL